MSLIASLKRIRFRCGPIGALVYLTYRFGNRVVYGALPRPLRTVAMVAYQALDLVIVRAIANASLPARAQLGTDVGLVHDANGIVVAPNAVIGDGCTLYHQTTIGVALDGTGQAPRLGNNVLVGAGAKILGGITIGDGARIGANSTVTRDVPPGVTVAGSPARPTRSAQPDAR